ncbi:hypothetical protein SAMN04487895_101261 [Paenibacillus sophorae]|uniref:Uncharacterized protein n=1 Tax=Paenibacillus sophorae TaxID=1333845 RepID=A0A1H8FVK6_9BACL|nr:hypothetical protein [Paenibacillus sophorae]QWU13993.1 hypothetical protein KP014_18860 [Paenibacillus sophorae]SEN35570.1 hypothetical protein SAMN04487895_101261 [Paenibacillus sophorae]
MYKLLYLIYFAVCACYFFLRFRRSLPEAAIRLAFASAFPLIGFLLPLFWPQRHRCDESQRIQSLEAYLRQDANADPFKVSHLSEAEKELNIVPLEEALLVNDLTSRRRTMIDLLKQDATEHLEVLRMAVGNEDTETSHYAVSAVVEIKRKLNQSLQEFSVRYETSRDDAHFLASYAEVLQNYMRSGFLDGSTLLQLKHSLAEVLQYWTEADPDAFEAHEQKVRIELELGNYIAAEQAAALMMERFPHREESYLAQMNLYFVLRSPQRFNHALQALKQSPVRLSNEALKLVRFWSEGA